MKKNAGKKKQQKVTKIVIGSVAGVVALGAIGTGLYFTVLKDKLDPNAGKIVVTDASGSEVAYEPSELQMQLDTPTFYQGIKINGVDVGGKTKDEVKAMFAEEADKPVTDEIDVKLQIEDDLIQMKTDGLHFTSDIDQVIETAYSYGRTSTLQGDDGLLDRYNTISALKTAPKEFACTYTLDTSAVDGLVEEALGTFDKKVEEASIEGFDVEKLEFIITESKEGYQVDVDKAKADVKAALDGSEYKVVVPVDAEITKPTTSSEDLKSKLGLVSTTTSKTSDNDNRNTNIRLICEHIDGLVLQPGESFDFNEFIGERTAEKGYKMAHGIFNGDMRDELGGGICQANTMLYQSVTKADLQVDERKNHSIPSTYVDKGTDATVTWKSPNFRFTNNSEYPIAIHAYYADLHVTVEIYGRLLPDGQHIELVGEHVRTISPSTVYVADSSLPVGTSSTVSSGRTGYDYKSYKVWYDKDGNEIKREEYFPSHYPSRDTVIHVGTMGADGNTYPMDPSTGKVDAPADLTPAPSDSDTTPDGSDPTTPPEGGEGGSGSETTPPEGGDTTPDTTPGTNETQADTTPDTQTTPETPSEGGGSEGGSSEAGGSEGGSSEGGSGSEGGGSEGGGEA